MAPQGKTVELDQRFFNFHHSYATIHDTTGREVRLKTGDTQSGCSLPFRSSRGEHRSSWLWKYQLYHRPISSSSSWSRLGRGDPRGGADVRGRPPPWHPPRSPAAGSGLSMTSVAECSGVSEGRGRGVEQGENKHITHLRCESGALPSSLYQKCKCF